MHKNNCLLPHTHLKPLLSKFLWTKKRKLILLLWWNFSMFNILALAEGLDYTGELNLGSNESVNVPRASWLKGYCGKLFHESSFTSYTTTCQISTFVRQMQFPFATQWLRVMLSTSPYMDCGIADTLIHLRGIGSRFKMSIAFSLRLAAITNSLPTQSTTCGGSAQNYACDLSH